ncbi:two-component sensor histidine kinase [[Clostridium] sordellii]|uniref:histidine kinase n=1 Tax=Paraclostridium sordellii TaxID=1505 RepID=A0ABP1XPF0_PARSO|nr:HAMP domain-containing sensor histidine kinase [Paeniclostridium sordellii]CEJ73245.1 his Kinase A domain protein [[Clostridium] sordellii] [Paeniclostridium sordellii]CEK30422.1 two-component sensor histidine kinase [[Clostridium] sordellii] [Paeniclostridium sordellii]CEN68798.1 two-component sensor histidine kinase [[Clostridium] sordellii] [Paeniclostridium sordellii]CEN72065.1 two-component sensor histidine kinase [[Clostridium] sordellii] [Paeniclostridium sordellii]CEO23053.1 two-com
MLELDRAKKIDMDNRVATKLTIAISVCLVFIYIISLMVTFHSNLNFSIKPEYFIRFFNIMLSFLAIISCLLCYDSTKKEELFIISLMYMIFLIDILLGVFDNLTLENTIISMKGYIAISTSIMRIIIILVAAFPIKQIRSFIMKNKTQVIIFILLTALCFGYMERESIIFPMNKDTEFFREYNFLLILIYTISSFIFFRKSIKENDYTYSVIGASILMLWIKAIYAIVGSDKPIMDIKYISISITYMSFIVLIVGLFLELILTIKKNRELKEEIKVFYNLVEENKHSCIYISDLNGNVLYSNKKMKKYLFKNEEIKVDILTEKVKDEINTINTDMLESIKKSIYDRGCWNGKIELKSGSTTIDCSVQTIIDSRLTNSNKKSGTARFVVTFTDVTEKDRMEKYKIEYEKMKDHEKVKSEFFANISHELRTPLNIFYSTVQLLDIKLNNNEEEFRKSYNKYRSSLRLNCQRMLRLINNIVDITKIDVGYTKPNIVNCDIVKLVEAITMSVIIYARQKDINIIFDTDVEELIIKCDPEMIERAVLNLLSNSIKFTKPNGNIFVSIYVNKEWVQIIFEDDGVGIPIHMQDLVFERFVQADKSLNRMNEGSGIGLSIVKSIIELNEGEIYLESDGENGTEFEILLPNKKLLGDDLIDKEIEYTIDMQKIELELSDIYELH